DDSRILERTADVLRGAGHTVDVAPNGRRALELLAGTISWDLVLTDVYMPGVDGWAVARAAKERAPATRVYLMTGFAEEMRARQQAEGVDGFVTKPLDEEGLRTVTVAAHAS